MRLRLASTAIGASTIRGMAIEGTIGPAREFLEKIDLDVFDGCDEVGYFAQLNTLTEQYLVEVPQLKWGATRKFLNIFLRDCLYNRWVCESYRMTTFEQFLEVPLDKDVVLELKSRAGRGNLPMWEGVNKLDRKNSELYQKFARNFAEGIQVLRVDLDIEFWRGELAQARKDKAKENKALKESTQKTVINEFTAKNEIVAAANSVSE